MSATEPDRPLFSVNINSLRELAALDEHLVEVKQELAYRGTPKARALADELGCKARPMGLRPTRAAAREAME